MSLPGINRRPRAARNPYFGALSATFTVAAEDTNAIAVAVQLTSRDYDVAERTPVQLYLSTDANGDVPAVGINAPNGGWAVGTDGTMVQSVPGDGLYAIGTLAIHSTPEQFKTTTTATFTIGGWQTTKSAATGLTFSAAHVITASTYGVILVQVNSAGTVSTKVPSATQAYASAALAFAALPNPDAGKVALGYIAIANNAGDWTANTDDLTDGSDVTTAAFVDAPLNALTSPASMTVLSEADGDIDLTVSETRIRTFYANALIGGRKFTSGAITFA